MQAKGIPGLAFYKVSTTRFSGEKAVEEIIQRLSQHHEVFVDLQARVGLPRPAALRKNCGTSTF